MTKIDLEELERKNALNHATGWPDDCEEPAVVLALLARIRELETACSCAAVALRMHMPSSPTAAHIDEILERGVVLP